MLEQPYLYRGYCRTGWVIYHELVKSFLPRTWPVTCHKTIPSNVRSRTRHFFKLPQIVAGHCKFQPIWPWPSKRFSARAVCIIPECWTSLTSVIHCSSEDSFQTTFLSRIYAWDIQIVVSPLPKCWSLDVNNWICNRDQCMLDACMS